MGKSGCDELFFNFHFFSFSGICKYCKNIDEHWHTENYVTDVTVFKSKATVLDVFEEDLTPVVLLFVQIQ